MALVSKAFGDIITFTRASTATFVGSNGLIQSAAIDTPRFDYDPVTLAAKGLLIEESRANLHLYSQDFSTNWQATATESTLTAAAATSPDGATNAGSFLCATTTDSARRLQASANINISPTTTYTTSIYLKPVNGWTWISFAFTAGTAVTEGFSRTFNIATGAVGTTGTSTAQSITAVGNGWFRLEMTGTTGASTGYRLKVILLDADEGAAQPAVGVVGAGVYVFGAQIEAGDFPTSYIPTTTTSLTRSDDVAQVNTLSPWFNATEGTLYGQATVPSVQLIERPIANLARSTAAAQDISVNISRASDSRRIAVILNSTQQFAYAPATAVTTTKGAVAYKENDSQGAFDGTASPVDTLVSLPTLITTLYIGKDEGAAVSRLNGHIQRITYYPRRLSEAELISITT